MIKYFETSTCPLNVTGVQVMRNTDYMPAMRAEAERFKKLVDDTMMVHAPEGTRTSIAECQHDFGPYLELRLYYNDDNKEHVEFMLWWEVNMPEEWEDTEVKNWKD